MSKQLYMPQMDKTDPMQTSQLQYYNALLYGGKCLQISKLDFTNAVKSFADALKEVIGDDGLPDGALHAFCYLEADATEVGQPRIARYRQDSGDPAAGVGTPIGDDSVFEISGRGNLEHFKIIGVTAGKNHTLRIEFYGQG